MMLAGKSNQRVEVVEALVQEAMPAKAKVLILQLGSRLQGQSWRLLHRKQSMVKCCLIWSKHLIEFHTDCFFRRQN